MIFTESQLAKLRKDYSEIQTINPQGKAYKLLVKVLDRMSDNQLRELAGAKIKFVSVLAQNRIGR